MGLGYFVGTWIERSHYASIRIRERELAGIIALPMKNPPQLAAASEPVMVSGSVVVSVDYFKAFLAGFRNLVGGRVRTYETLLDRGRREAILRMKSAAQRAGCNAIVCMRIESTNMASGGSSKKTLGVEVMAYGTAVRISADG